MSLEKGLNVVCEVLESPWQSVLAEIGHRTLPPVGYLVMAQITVFW